ncbi:Valine--tRNA ligase [Dirofilaria immitis]
MRIFSRIIIFWHIRLLHFGIANLDVPKPFISMSLRCYTYQKINGQIRKHFMDDCTFGNMCCYSVDFINKKTGDTVEFGGCEDEYRFIVGTHPTLGTMLPFTVSYICEEGACTERTTNRDTTRLCACTDHYCNKDGINTTIHDYYDRVRKGLIKTPPDYINFLEQTVQILADG